MVVEQLEYRQYMVKVDGSGRVLLRTRWHLRKVKPSTRNSGWADLDPQGGEQGEPEGKLLHIPVGTKAGMVHHLAHGHNGVLQDGEQVQEGSVVQGHVYEPEQDQPVAAVQTPEVRRSSRVRREKKDENFV